MSPSFFKRIPVKPMPMASNNKPIDDGLSKAFSEHIIEIDDSYIGLTDAQKALKRKFPLIVERNDDNISNKIEKITDIIYVKRLVDITYIF